MDGITQNSGSTFIADGGELNIKVCSNVAWEFALCGNTNNWLSIKNDFGEKVQSLKGRNTKFVTLVAEKNESEAYRYCSGFCESNQYDRTDGETPDAWVGFMQVSGETPGPGPTPPGPTPTDTEIRLKVNYQDGTVYVSEDTLNFRVTTSPYGITSYYITQDGEIVTHNLDSAYEDFFPFPLSHTTCVVEAISEIDQYKETVTVVRQETKTYFNWVESDLYTIQINDIVSDGETLNLEYRIKGYDITGFDVNDESIISKDSVNIDETSKTISFKINKNNGNKKREVVLSINGYDEEESWYGIIGYAYISQLPPLYFYWDENGKNDCESIHTFGIYGNMKIINFTTNYEYPKLKVKVVDGEEWVERCELPTYYPQLPTPKHVSVELTENKTSDIRHLSLIMCYDTYDNVIGTYGFKQEALDVAAKISCNKPIISKDETFFIFTVIPNGGFEYDVYVRYYDAEEGKTKRVLLITTNGTLENYKYECGVYSGYSGRSFTIEVCWYDEAREEEKLLDELLLEQKSE